MLNHRIKSIRYVQYRIGQDLRRQGYDLAERLEQQMRTAATVVAVIKSDQMERRAAE